MLKKICFGLIGAWVLSGCAGQTTDPRQGGLFSYDPDAYEQRIAERKARLEALESDTAVQEKRNKELKREKSRLHKK